MLKEVTERECISLSGLSITENKVGPELIFDPEKEISVQTWDNIRNYIDWIKKVNLDLTTQSLTWLKLLSKNKYKATIPTLPDNIGNRFFRVLDAQSRSFDRDRTCFTISPVESGVRLFVDRLFCLKVLFPGNYQQLTEVLGLTEDCYQKMTMGLFGNSADIVYDDFFDAVKLEVVSSGVVSKYGFAKNFRPEISSRLSNRHPGILALAPKMCAFMKTFNPEEIIAYRVTKKDWDLAKMALNGAEETDVINGNYSEYLNRAAMLYIASADQLSVDKNGLVVKFKTLTDLLYTKTTDLPERKKYVN